MKHNLAGRYFGKWKVTNTHRLGKDRHTQWLCVCKCGTEQYVSASKLIAGKSTSCGCDRGEKLHNAFAGNPTNPKEDLTGYESGELVVIGPFRTAPTGHREWLCRCSCGSMGYYRETRLRAKEVLSCGHASTKRGGKEKPIESLNIGTRAINGLHKNKIYLVEDLLCCTKKDLLLMPQLGKESCDQIEACIKEAGLEEEWLAASAKTKPEGIDLDELDLLVRTKNALRRNGISTLEKLQTYSYEQLLQLPKMGETSSKDARKYLK